MAQRRRKETLEKRRQRKMTLLCILGGTGAMLISLALCLVFFDIGPGSEAPAAPVSTSLPYDAASPFSAGDLTGEQLSQLRSVGRMSVSDGPRGISVGDSLDTLLARYPSTFTQLQPETDLTGEQSREEIILYCASYFENQNGIMTALPPRGLLTVDGGMILVTLLAPTTAYPAGTLDNYGSYEHVYCIYTVEPAGMTVSSIVLGLTK